jgi:uncharacterized protein (DUF1778 family)
MNGRDPVTGMSDADVAALAEDAYRQRGRADAWAPEVRPELAADVRSVVSVRFSRGELGPVEQAAAAAGVPISTFIRNAAVSAATAIDLDQAQRTIDALHTQLDALGKALGIASRPGQSGPRRKRSAA